MSRAAGGRWTRKWHAVRLWWARDAERTVRPSRHGWRSPPAPGAHHDSARADLGTDELRSRGYEVEQCWGPKYTSCPVMRGEKCAAADRADVFVYDVFSTGETDGGRSLISGLRDLYPHTPVVLTAPGMELEWVEIEGPHRVIPLVGPPTSARLLEAIGQALATEREPVQPATL